jgi:hypothetical protein
MFTTSTTPAVSAETTTADMSPATSAPVDATCWLMDIPLELRYKIFELVAARDKAPEHVFAHWFEKRDVDQQIAAHLIAHPTGVAPVGKYTRFKIEVEQEADDAVVGDSDGEQQDDNGDNEDGEDEDDEDDEGDDEDEDNEDMDEEEHQDGDGDMVGDGSNITTTATTDTPPTLPTPTVAASLADEDEGEDEDREQDHEDDEEDDMSEANNDVADNDEADNDEADNDEDGNNDQTVNANGIVTTAPPAPVSQASPRPQVIEPAPKWRHIPKFMSISHCPPPTEVLLASKELNRQAMDWFYEAAVLRIKGTASFAHPTFFEEAFQQLFDAAFSPMENIRKAEIVLVWDTAWIRASDDRGLYEAILPAFLRQRTAFIIKTLKRAPMLRDLVIHWHDSLKDDDSEALKYDVLADFYNIPAANINVEEHFIAPDAKPLRKSKAGKFRLELMDIANRGIECLYQS